MIKNLTSANRPDSLTDDGGVEIRTLLSELIRDENVGKFASVLLDEFSAIDKITQP